MPPQKKRVYKCIKPDVPRAKTAIFTTTVWGGLEYREERQDEKRPSDEHGYITTSHGDSGSPYWTVEEQKKERLPNGKEVGPEVAILVALVSAGIDMSPINTAGYVKDEEKPCRDVATKLTPDIIRWAMEKSGII